MTQFAASDELAQTIFSAASNRRCIPEELMQQLLARMEDDDACAERLLTSEQQARMIRGAEQAAQGNFTTEEEVDRKFDAFFRSLEVR